MNLLTPNQVADQLGIPKGQILESGGESDGRGREGIERTTWPAALTGCGMEIRRL